MTGCCQVTTTLPDRAAAERLASVLVEERLAACVQVLGPIVSTYRWKDQIERADEWYCHVKTTLDRLTAAQARIRELHSYEQPEIIALPITGGDPGYLRWIKDAVSGESEV